MDDPVLRAFDAGDASPQKGLHLASIQVPPAALFDMVPTLQHPITLRARPSDAAFVLHADVHALFGRISQLAGIARPGPEVVVRTRPPSNDIRGDEV